MNYLVRKNILENETGEWQNKSKLTDLTKHAIPKAARLTAENQRTIGGNTLTKGLQGQLLQAPVR